MSLPEQEVDHALALIEQFETLLENLKTFQKGLRPKQAQELDVYSKSLEGLIAVLDVVNSPLDGLATPLERPHRSLVTRLGLSGELLKRRADPQCTYAQMAAEFSISESTIKRFYAYYDKCKPTEKAKLQQTSIFDSTKQLEDLSIMIQRNMARLEGMNDEVNVKFVSEMRQLIELAADVAERMSNYTRYSAFMNAVYDLLISELPARRSEILQKLMGAAGTAQFNGPKQSLSADAALAQHISPPLS